MAQLPISVRVHGAGEGERRLVQHVVLYLWLGALGLQVAHVAGQDGGRGGRWRHWRCCWLDGLDGGRRYRAHFGQVDYSGLEHRDLDGVDPVWAENKILSRDVYLKSIFK